MARRRQAEATTSSPLPASKRQKTTETTHVPARAGLGFLVDEDARKGRKLEAKLTNGAPSSKTTRVDESQAVVAPDTKGYGVNRNAGSSPDDTINISSGDESSSDDSSDDDDEEDAVQRTSGKQSADKSLTNGHAFRDRGESSEEAVGGVEEDVDMAEPDLQPETIEEEPSFADLLQQRHPEAIDVYNSLPNPTADRQALVSTSNNRAITAPSGTSLTTVLTQALRTNDKDLLESCFHTNDLASIRATIERLQSQHVATLLQRLAERIHKRPGRTGSLLVWVQWCLIAHGGYLATQPEMMKKLKGLSQVVQERANGLQPLLHLKGKLDMLSAQLELRRNLQKASWAANADEDEEDEGVVYVEGQDEDWSDSGEEDGEGMPAAAIGTIESNATSKSKAKAQNPTPITDLSDSEDDSDSDDDDMPNGVVREGNDESSDDEDDEEGGLFDMEAEETFDDADDLEKDSDSDYASSPLESDDDSDASNHDTDDEGVKAPLPKTLNRKK